MISPFSAAPLRVAIFVTNAAGTYGGGRLAAFLLAHCLARAGAAVSFVTNAKPVFFDELRAFGAPGRVALHLTRDFHAGLPEGGFDAVVIIPGQSQERQFYMGARGFARRRGARLVLFNFETPNWFNSHSPAARSEDLWLEWRRCIEDGCLVLSNSAQSMRFAERYYVSHPATTRFGFWHQPVNVQALAGVAAQYREDRVVCFVRARDPHKGGQDLIDLLSEDLRGWTLSLIVGSAKLDEEYREAIVSQARRFGIGVEVKPLLTDTEKFVELKRARMLVYPSLFEGYGIPPIEALSAGTPCVCYDLPVFREVCGDALIVAAPGDVEGLRAGVRRVIASRPEDWAHLPQAVAAVRSIEHCGQQALTTIHDYVQNAPGIEAPGAVPEPRAQRPVPELLQIDDVRLDSGGFLELRGWTALRDRARLVVSVGGQRLGEVTRGLPRPEVRQQHPWVGGADCGFAACLPFRTDAREIAVTVTALGPDGTQFDSATRSFAVPAIRKPTPKPDPALYQRGGIKWLREAETGFVHGWIAAAAPVLSMAAYAGGQPLWLQRGRSRPDVMAKLDGMPPQAPGFGLYLDAAATALLDAAPELALVTTTADGVFLERLKLKPEAVPAGVPELSPAEAPPGLPLQARIRSVTYDEYGVVEFEGWVLAQPRIDVMKFWLGDVFLGEAVPDRLYLNIFEKNRAYADAFCGVQFTGRAQDQPRDAAHWRVELCYGDDPALVLEGTATPTARASAVLGADAALLPADFLASATLPPVVAVVVEDASPLRAPCGAVLRALLAHLRQRGFGLLLVLHGNPHRFSDDLPQWQALADGALLVNPLSPSPRPGAAPLPHAAWNRSSPALQGVLAELAAQMPRLAAVLVQGQDLAPALAAVPGAATLVMDDAPPVPLPWRDAAPPGTRLLGTALPPVPGILPLALDAVAIAAGVAPLPAPDAPGWLVLNGCGAGPGVLARACAAAANAADEAGLRLGVVVDAPPLEPSQRLRARLGLPDAAEPLWPAQLAALPAARVRAVVDLGAAAPGMVDAIAIARGMPLALWRLFAPAGLQRPWPAMGMAEILAGPAPTPPAADPYAALDALLGAAAAGRECPMAAE